MAIHHRVLDGFSSSPYFRPSTVTTCVASSEHIWMQEFTDRVSDGISSAETADENGARSAIALGNRRSWFRSIGAFA